MIRLVQAGIAALCALLVVGCVSLTPPNGGQANVERVGSAGNRRLIERYDAQRQRSAAQFTRWSRSEHLARPSIHVGLGHWNAIDSVTFSPDGRFVLTGSMDGSTGLWQVSTGREIRTFYSTVGGVHVARFSRDGKRVITADDDGTVRIWNTATGRRIASFTGNKGQVFALAVSPNGKDVATGSSDGSAKVWNLQTQKVIASLKPGEGAVDALAFSPDGIHLVVGFDKDVAMLWNRETNVVRETFSGPRAGISAVAVSPNGHYAAVAAFDGMPTDVWDLATGKMLRQLAKGNGAGTAIAFTPDGTHLVTNGAGRALTIWDLNTGKRGKTLFRSDSYVASVHYSPDGKHLVAGLDNGTAVILDASTGTTSRVLAGAPSRVRSVAISPDGRTVMSGSNDGLVQIWNLQSGRTIATMNTGGTPAYSVAFSRDGTMAAAASNGRVFLWSTASGALVRTLKAGSAPIYSIAFTPGGSSLFAGAQDGTAYLWDVADGTITEQLKTDLGSISSVAISPIGSVGAVAASTKGKIELWNLKTGSKALTLSKGLSWVYGVRFARGGDRLVVASGFSPKLFDAATGNEIRAFARRHGEVMSIAVSPRGGRYLSGSSNNTAILWDAASGSAITTFTGYRSTIDATAISPNGRFGVTGSAGGTVRVLDLADGKTIYTRFSSSAGNSLSWTPDDNFSGSLALAKKRVYLVDGMSTSSPGTLFERHYVLEIGPARMAQTATASPAAAALPPLLQKAVRAAIDKQHGALTPYDLARTTSLDLSNLGLTSLPAGIRWLNGLESINLSGNGFTRVPRRLGLLTGLRRINLSHNRITTLQGFSSVGAAPRIDLTGDPVRSIAPSWIESPHKPIGISLPVWQRAFYRKLEEEIAKGGDRQQFVKLYENGAAILASYTKRKPDGTVVTPYWTVIPGRAIYNGTGTAIIERRVASGYFPPGQVPPKGSVAGSAIYLHGMVFPVYLINSYDRVLAVDGNRSGTIQQSEAFPVASLRRTIRVQLPDRPYFIDLIKLRHYPSGNQSSRGAKEKLGLNYASDSAALYSVEGKTYLASDVNSDGYFDDVDDTVFQIGPHGDVLARRKSELMSYTSGHGGSSNLILERESKGTMIFAPASLSAKVRRFAWAPADRRMRPIRFGLKRRLDDVWAAEPSDILLVAKDATRFYAVGSTGSGPLHYGAGGGPAWFTFDGQGRIVPEKAFPMQGRNTILSWREGDGSILFPRVTRRNGALQISWIRSLAFGSPSGVFTPQEVNRLDRGAPKSLSVPLASLQIPTRLMSAANKFVVQDQKFGRTLISLGQGSKRYLVVLSAKGTVERELGPGEYQYPRLGASPGAVMYVHNGFGSDSYGIRDPRTSGDLFLDTPTGTRTLASHVVFYRVSHDGSRILSLQSPATNVRRLVVEDVPTRKTFELFRQEYSSVGLSGWGFVPGTDHVFYPQSGRLWIDSYDTGIKGSTFAFSQARDSVYTIRKSAFLVRDPLSVNALLSDGKLWPRAAAPWSENAARVALSKAAIEAYSDPKQALSLLHSITEPKPSSAEYRRYNSIYLSALENGRDWGAAIARARGLFASTGFSTPSMALRIARLYEKAGNLSAGVAQARSALKRWPDSQQLRAQLAKMLLEDGQFAASSREFKTFLGSALQGDKHALQQKEFQFDLFLEALALDGQTTRAYAYLRDVDPLAPATSADLIGLRWGIPTASVGGAVELVSTTRWELYTYLYFKADDTARLDRLMRLENASGSLSPEAYCYMLAVLRQLNNGTLPKNAFAGPIVSQAALAVDTQMQRSTESALTWAAKQPDPQVMKTLVAFAAGRKPAAAGTAGRTGYTSNGFWNMLLSAVHPYPGS